MVTMMVKKNSVASETFSSLAMESPLGQNGHELEVGGVCRGKTSMSQEYDWN